MAKAEARKWEFKARFRRHAFGWKSQPAINRIKEAVSEIRKAARKEPVLAAEGAVLFLEKLSPALENVDSSSGAIGTATNNAIDALVPIIARAPAGATVRHGWLERLWDAFQDDGYGYLDTLGDSWGDLCASPDVASYWVDQLLGTARLAWRPEPDVHGFFKGTIPCLSAMLAAGRYDDLLELLAIAPHSMWAYRRYGVKALAAMGRKGEAIRYAEQSLEQEDRPVAIARACEEILLSSGLADEAYRRYGLLANRAGTYLAWFRAVAKKYPQRKPEEILADLVAITPGEEGKWFAAAKDAGLFDEAIALANRSPCDPRTLARAARDHAESNPTFALEAGVAALRWLTEGWGYEITSLDVLTAYTYAMNAAAKAGREEETRRRIRDLVAGETPNDRFVTKVLGRQLGLS
jgi:hypothetical protein